MRSELAHIGGRDEIIENGPLRGIEVRPVISLGERETVREIARVEAASRVLVVPPGASDFRVLLEDDDGNARLSEAVGHDDPGHPGPDDRHIEFTIRRYGLFLPVGSAGVVKPEFMNDEREIIIGRIAGYELDQIVQFFLGKILRLRASRIPVSANGLYCCGSGLFL